ncbi:MAG: hypothetical protein LBV51_01595 [Acholeplasmatales bacterium]|jgi:hypothetical protein|nr:hypothetical protein [Acholeplasmatales bacterium]
MDKKPLAYRTYLHLIYLGAAIFVELLFFFLFFYICSLNKDYSVLINSIPGWVLFILLDGFFIFMFFRNPKVTIYYDREYIYLAKSKTQIKISDIVNVTYRRTFSRYFLSTITISCRNNEYSVGGIRYINGTVEKLIDLKLRYRKPTK